VRPTVAIGGSDAHALRKRMGPLRRVVFPYDYHFRAVNTHLLLDEPLTGDALRDASLIYAALAAGRCFIAYDLARQARRLSVSGHGPQEGKTTMGSQIPLGSGASLHAALPHCCEIRLRKDGSLIQMVVGQELTHVARDPGAYRIEAYRRFRARRRAWIFSNPIYLT